jgi:hypothetical protein
MRCPDVDDLGLRRDLGSRADELVQGRPKDDRPTHVGTGHARRRGRHECCCPDYCCPEYYGAECSGRNIGGCDIGDSTAVGLAVGDGLRHAVTYRSRLAEAALRHT